MACVAAALCLLSTSGRSDEASAPPQINVEGTHMTSHERIQLPSGLSYEILKPAAPNAASPQKGDTVVVNYTGWLDNQGKEGKKFDSSLDRKVPFSFKIGVGQVIQGWDIGVMQMKVGEKCRLFIPAKLGYGARGAGGAIPPNADLIFDVELLDIKK